MDGNTWYYLCIDGVWYSGKAADTPELILLNVGDVVTVRCYAAAGGIAQPIYSIESGADQPPAAPDGVEDTAENAV